MLMTSSAQDYNAAGAAFLICASSMFQGTSLLLLHILGSREVWWLLTTFYLPHHKHRSARNPLHTTLLSKLPRQLLCIFANSFPKPLSAFAYTGLQSAPPLANNQLLKNLDSKWQLLGGFYYVWKVVCCADCSSIRKSLSLLEVFSTNRWHRHGGGGG